MTDRLRNQKTFMEEYAKAKKRECPVCKAAPDEDCKGVVIGTHAKRIWKDWK